MIMQGIYKIITTITINSIIIIIVIIVKVIIIDHIFCSFSLFAIKICLSYKRYL